MARKPPRRAKSPSIKRDEDKRAAQWFDAGVAAYDKADAYAEEAQLDKSELSRMRSGNIAVALRRTIPMQDHAPAALAFCEAFLSEVNVSECPDAVLSLVTGLLEAIGMVARPKGGITAAQVGVIAARLLTENRATREMLERECHREYGASTVDVAMALRGEGEER